MATLADDFAFVAASVERAATTQRDLCRAVLAGNPDRGTALARHLEHAYEAILHHLEARRSEFDQALDDVVRQDAIVEMRHLLWDVRDLQSNLLWLDAAEHPALDLGTTYFVESVARAVVARNVELTVVPTTSNGSYATTSDPYGRLIAAWGQNDPGSDATVVVVFVPRREQHSGLLHPLIIHELGHAADDARGIVHAIWRQAGERPALRQRFSEAVTAEAQEQDVDPVEINAHTTERLLSWIAEALCDAVAVHQLGPTYLYAFLAEVVAGDVDSPTARHPSPRQRVTHMLRQLERLGWTPSMQAAVPQLAEWIDELVSEPVQHHGVDEFLGWALDDLSVLVRRYAAGIIGRRTFRPDVALMGETAALLDAAIPPAQRSSGEAVPPEAIILASWHAALVECGEGPASIAVAPDARALSELLPSTLELSALVDAWRAQ